MQRPPSLPVGLGTIAAFAIGSAKLDAPLRSQVIALAREIKADGDKTISITGYTDSTGTRSQ